MASILIAEHRVVDRLFLATLPEYRGHGILEASDGAEALALVQSRRPSALRGEAERKRTMDTWRGSGGRDGADSPTARAQVFARPAGTDPLVLYAWV